MHLFILIHKKIEIFLKWEKSAIVCFYFVILLIHRS